MITLDHISKTYDKGKVLAVKDVSFSVEKGELFGLIGPDGAGKIGMLARCIDCSDQFRQRQAPGPGDRFQLVPKRIFKILSRANANDSNFNRYNFT